MIIYLAHLSTAVLCAEGHQNKSANEKQSGQPWASTNHDRQALSHSIWSSWYDLNNLEVDGLFPTVLDSLLDQPWSWLLVNTSSSEKMIQSSVPGIKNHWIAKGSFLVLEHGLTNIKLTQTWWQASTGMLVEDAPSHVDNNHWNNDGSAHFDPQLEHHLVCWVHPLVI